MTIEIRQPEVEALIRERMAAGRFATAEDALRQALEAAPPPASEILSNERTGAEIIAAMQRMPYKNVDIEPERLYMRVSDPVTFE
jgi:hypothetical protein